MIEKDVFIAPRRNAQFEPPGEFTQRNPIQAEGFFPTWRLFVYDKHL